MEGPLDQGLHTAALDRNAPEGQRPGKPGDANQVAALQDRQQSDGGAAQLPGPAPLIGGCDDVARVDPGSLWVGSRTRRFLLEGLGLPDVSGDYPRQGIDGWGPE